MSTKVIETYEELMKSKDVWNSAFDKSINVRHPFMDYNWVRLYSKYFCDEGRLNVMVCRHLNDLTILPFVKTKTMYKGLSSMGEGLFDYRDALMPSQAPVSFDEIGQKFHIDMVSFPRLREDSPLYKSLNDYRSESFQSVISESVKSPYLDMSEISWDKYYKGLRKRFRQDLKRQIRRLSEIGDLNFGHCQNDEELPLLSSILYQQHIIRRQYLGQNKSIFLDRTMRSFFDELNRECLSNQQLRLFYLKIKDETIALALCYLYDDCLYYYIPTFDTAYATYSPGRVLLYYIMKHGFQKEWREIDFMGGAEDYKYDWNAVDRQTYDVRLFSRNWKGAVAKICYFARSAWLKLYFKLADSPLRNIKRRLMRRRI